MTVLAGRYEVLATLGSGGEARVLKALDHQHDRLVAVKVRPVRDEAVREDVLREARILLAVPPHPALPLVREDFFDGDGYVVVMDWVDGTDLATLLRDEGRPGLPPSSVLAYLAQAAEALTHLHTQPSPVIHGDVKPGNLILTRGGRVKLVDFGLSSAPNMPRARTGTPGFRAPELAAGAAPTRASDVYALAATAFALLTGSAPAGVLPAWEGIDPAQAEQLEAAIRMGMAVDPARRPATPGELVERLRAGWETGLPTGVVTFILSDIEGSTALWDGHPEAMAAALVRHDELIAAAVEAHGGSVIQTMGEGDSTVSVFASAPDAVAAALAANRAIGAAQWPPELRIKVRWGLHTGEVERRGLEYRGATIILAARVRGQADGDQVLLSEVTSQLVAGHLPDGYELVDLGPHTLKGLARPERIRALKGPGVDTPFPATESPYRGLLPFQAGDRAMFFGREAVVQELIARLAPGRLLAVVGASGSGKSSVLRAGVMAAVRAGEVSGLHDATLLTPGRDPRLDVPGDPERLVIVDQFEELFTQCADEQRRTAFIESLIALPCAVAIGVRADLYGRLSEHPALAEAVAAHHVLLGAMRPEELERAVTEPARLAGLKLEPGLAELILRDVTGEPGALPLLSHALQATWEHRDGRTLTLDGYRRSGGVASAIATTADAVLEALPAARRNLARNVFVRMTQLGQGIDDTSRRVTIDELVPEGGDDMPVRELVDRLAEARLVTLDDGTAQVAHEALIREWPRLRRWLDEDREGIQTHRRLGDAAVIWDEGGREPSDLYRGVRLAAVTELARSGRVELNALERAFLDASTAEAERERRAERRRNRRLRGLLGTSVALLLAAIVAGAVSLNQRNHARHAEGAARTQALASDAERVGALARNVPTLDLSLLTALVGTRLQDSVETRGDLLAVLQHNPAAVRVFKVTDANLSAMAGAPDGRLLATGDQSGVVRFIDLRSFTASGASVRLGAPVTAQAIAYAPDGRTVALATVAQNPSLGLASGRAQLELVDVAARRVRRAAAWPGLAMSAAAQLAYSPDGRRLALSRAVTSGGPPVWQLLMLDARDGHRLWQRDYPRAGQDTVGVAFTPGGRLITSRSQADTLVWDARTGRVVRRFPIGGLPAVAPDGRSVALGLNSADLATPSSAVALLSLRTGRVRRLVATLNDEWLLDLAFTHDGSRIVGPAFQSTHVWDVRSGQITETYPGTQRNGANPGVVIGRRGVALVVAGGGGVSVWATGDAPRLARHFTGVQTVFAPRGHLMASAQVDGSSAVIDRRTMRVQRRLPAADGPFDEELGFLPDGRRLVTAGAGGTATLWDAARGVTLRRLRFGGQVLGGAVSPDGRLVAVQWQAPGSTGSTVEVRDLASDRTRYTRAMSAGAGTVAFAAGGGEIVATGCCLGGSTIAAWDARSGAPVFRRTPRAPVISLSAWPDARRFLVGTQDGRVLALDARTGRQIGPATTVSASPVTQVAASHDGRLFASAARNGTLTLWDLRTRRRIGDQFPVGPSTIPGVVFEPGGRLVVNDQISRSAEWPLDLATLRRAACSIAGRDITREEWRNLVPDRPYERVCPA